jgi:threonine/homoserine/homoserine lactone efflux protein
MIASSTLLAFIAAAFIMVVIPGPTVLFTIGRSIALGRLGGFLSIIGTAVGSIVLVLGVALGVGTVIAQSVVLFTVVKVLGAGYLIFLGIQAIRHRKDAAATIAQAGQARPGWRLLLEGFVVGVTTRSRSHSSSRSSPSSSTCTRAPCRCSCSCSARSSS